jgi:hypothetical protein
MLAPLAPGIRFMRQNEKNRLASANWKNAKNITISIKNVSDKIFGRFKQNKQRYLCRKVKRAMIYLRVILSRSCWLILFF